MCLLSHVAVESGSGSDRSAAGRRHRRRVRTGPLATARLCFVLFCLTARRRRTANKTHAIKDGGEGTPRTSPEAAGGTGTLPFAGRNITNRHQSLHTPEFTLSLIFPRESRRGWWPETRPQLALSLLYCWRSRSPGGRRRSRIALVGASGRVGGATAALTGAGFEAGPTRLLGGGASAGNGRGFWLSGWAGFTMPSRFLYFKF